MLQKKVSEKRACPAKEDKSEYNLADCKRY